MKSEVKKQWVDALRSGRFAQGVGCLNHADKYCCLGVLSELAHLAGAVAKDIDAGGLARYGESRQGLTLPMEVRDWAGLQDASPYVKRHGADKCLTALNDEGWRFADIATLIEGQL